MKKAALGLTLALTMSAVIACAPGGTQDGGNQGTGTAQDPTFRGAAYQQDQFGIRAGEDRRSLFGQRNGGQMIGNDGGNRGWHNENQGLNRGVTPYGQGARTNYGRTYTEDLGPAQPYVGQQHNQDFRGLHGRNQNQGGALQHDGTNTVRGRNGGGIGANVYGNRGGNGLLTGQNTRNGGGIFNDRTERTPGQGGGIFGNRNHQNHAGQGGTLFGGTAPRQNETIDSYEGARNYPYGNQGIGRADHQGQQQGVDHRGAGHRGTAAFDHKNARTLEQRVEKIDGVKAANVVVYQNDIIVGVETEGKQNQIEQKIKQQLEGSANGKQIHVTTDKEINTRIGGMTKRMTDGQPIRNAANDVGEIISDIGRTLTAPVRNR